MSQDIAGTLWHYCADIYAAQFGDNEMSVQDNLQAIVLLAQTQMDIKPIAWAPDWMYGLMLSALNKDWQTVANKAAGTLQEGYYND